MRLSFSPTVWMMPSACDVFPSAFMSVYIIFELSCSEFCILLFVVSDIVVVVRSILLSVIVSDADEGCDAGSCGVEACDTDV